MARAGSKQGTAAKTGRSAPKRSNRMDFRVDDEQKELIGRAASYTGESLTGFAISALVREARRVIRAHERVRLSNRDRERFLALLDRPPEPSPALRRAAERHRELIVPAERDQ